jgi:nitrate reductase beta subunit
MLAMRSNQRSIAIEGKPNAEALANVGLSEQQAAEMYRMLGIANYDDRFVIPTTHDELRQDDAYAFQGQNGFAPGNTSSGGISGFSLFPTRRTESVSPIEFVPPKREKV